MHEISVAFTLILDSPTSSIRMMMHVIDYKIFGSEMQFVEIELDPGRQPWPRRAG